MRSSESGFSLAEVVVALGLLGSVLISVAGLVVVGNRQVARGRSSSEALALGRRVLEEMKSWSFERTTSAFSDVCVLTQPTCTLVSAPDDVIPTAAEQAAQWQAQLADTLGDGRVRITLDSLDAAALSASRSLRVTVAVEWNEGVHARSISLATTRM